MAREAETLKGRCIPVVGYQIQGAFKQKQLSFHGEFTARFLPNL